MKNKVFVSLLTVFTLLMISQTASAKTHVIGEAGLETGLSDDEWQSVALDSSLYSDTPLVFVTTQTVNGGDDPSSAHLRSVSQSGFDTQHCEPDAYACDSHAAEDNAWLALDLDKVRESVGMDAGTVSISGDGTASVTFDDIHVDSAPIVIAQVQTNNGAVPINAKVTSVDSNGATISMCEQDSQDACNTGHTTETVAWFAVTTEEANRLAGWEANWEDKGDSNWVRTDFVDVSFGSAPGVQVTTQTQNGGEDDLYPEVNDVTTTGADIRLCEYQGDGSCDTHYTETLGYIAVENGDVSANKHMCDVDDMEVDLRSVAGMEETTVTSINFDSITGDCFDGDSTITEEWREDTSFSYCPIEGEYDANVNAHTEDETYSWESSGWVDSLYNVDYDAKSWCSCGNSYSDNEYQWIYSDGDVSQTNVDNSAENSFGCCENDNVLWYNFEGSSDNPVDRYGSNDGTFMGDAEKRPVTSFSHTGDTGAYFDGSGDYIEVPDSDSLDLTREFSISAWIMHSGSDGDQNIVTKEYAYEVALASDGELKWAFYTDGGWEWYNTGYTVPEGEWHHVIFSYENLDTTVYVDGTEVDTQADDDGGSIGTNTNDVWIGGRALSGGMSWFNGYMDEVRITSSAIGPQEASHLHEHGLKETWADPGTGEPACVDSKTVQDGDLSSGRRFLVTDGEINFCKIPAVDDTPESFMNTYYECDYINTGPETYYCGAGGSDKEGMWYTLDNSGCSGVTKIRGGRVQVH